MRLTASVSLLAWVGAVQAQPGNTDEAAAMAAAMKRAEMLASGPMRVIMEAGKVRRREAAVPPDGAPAPRAAVAGRLLAARLMGVALPAALAPLPREHLPVDVSAALATPQPADLGVLATAGPPRLVRSVDPAIPQAARLQAASVNAVQADLTLRPDGTVADVALLPPVPRSWQRYLREALLQWRFEPQSGGVVHRVQIVFAES